MSLLMRSDSEIHRSRRSNRILIINETIEIKLDVSSDDESERLYIAEFSGEETEESINTIVAEDEGHVEPPNSDSELSENIKLLKRNSELEQNGVTENENNELVFKRLEIENNFVKIAPKTDSHGFVTNINDNVNWEKPFSHQQQLKKNRKQIGNNIKDKSSLIDLTKTENVSCAGKTLHKKKRFCSNKNVKKIPEPTIKEKESLVCVMKKSDDSQKFISENCLKKQNYEVENIEDNLSMELVEPESSTCLHDSDNNYLNCCPYCSYKTYKTKNNLIDKHLLIHHFLYSECPHCHFHAYSWRSMESHFRIKHRSLEIPCLYCDNKLSVASLKIHVYNKHFSTILRTCKLCGVVMTKSTNIKAKMRQHVFESHLSTSNNNLVCPICDFKSSVRLEIRSHIYTDHSDIKGRIFNCVVCNLITLSLTELIAHTQKVHEKRKKILCKYCNFICFSQFQMGFHMKTHKKKVLHFTCPFCRNKCREHFTLKYHIVKCRRKNSYPSKEKCF